MLMVLFLILIMMPTLMVILISMLIPIAMDDAMVGESLSVSTVIILQYGIGEEHAYPSLPGYLWVISISSMNP